MKTYYKNFYKWISETGIYIIEGEADARRMLINKMNLYEIHAKEDLREAVFDAVFTCNGDVVLCDAPVDLDESFMLLLIELSKEFHIRIFISFMKAVDIDRIFLYAQGSIQAILQREAGVLELNVDTRKCEKFILDTDEVCIDREKEISCKLIKIINDLGYENISEYLEKYMDKYSRDKTIADYIVMRCFEDICINREACNLQLSINMEKYKKYECCYDEMILKIPGNIVELWQNVLMYGNGLYQYVSEVIEGDMALFFLFKKYDLNKAIAVMEARKDIK